MRPWALFCVIVATLTTLAMSSEDEPGLQAKATCFEQTADDECRVFFGSELDHNANVEVVQTSISFLQMIDAGSSGSASETFRILDAAGNNSTLPSVLEPGVVPYLFSVVWSCPQGPASSPVWRVEARTASGQSLSSGTSGLMPQGTCSQERACVRVSTPGFCDAVVWSSERYKDENDVWPWLSLSQNDTLESVHGAPDLTPSYSLFVPCGHRLTGPSTFFGDYYYLAYGYEEFEDVESVLFGPANLEIATADLCPEDAETCSRGAAFPVVGSPARAVLVEGVVAFGMWMRLSKAEMLETSQTMTASEIAWTVGDLTLAWVHDRNVEWASWRPEVRVQNPSPRNYTTRYLHDASGTWPRLLDDDTWHHYAVDWDISAGVVHLYVDSLLSARASGLNPDGVSVSDMRESRSLNLGVATGPALVTGQLGLFAFYKGAPRGQLGVWKRSRAAWGSHDDAPLALWTWTQGVRAARDQVSPGQGDVLASPSEVVEFGQLECPWLHDAPQPSSQEGDGSGPRPDLGDGVDNPDTPIDETCLYIVDMGNERGSEAFAMVDFVGDSVAPGGDALSLGAWVRLRPTERFPATLFSYSVGSKQVTGRDNEFVCGWKDATTFTASVQGNDYEVAVDGPPTFVGDAGDRDWHYVLCSWDGRRGSGDEGTFSIYIDGVLAAKRNIAVPLEVWPGGTLVIGQDQDDIARPPESDSFDAAQAFVGDVHLVCTVPGLFVTPVRAAELYGSYAGDLASAHPTTGVCWEHAFARGGIILDPRTESSASNVPGKHPMLVETPEGFGSAAMQAFPPGCHLPGILQTFLGFVDQATITMAEYPPIEALNLMTDRHGFRWDDATEFLDVAHHSLQGCGCALEFPVQEFVTRDPTFEEPTASRIGWGGDGDAPLLEFTISVHASFPHSIDKMTLYALGLPEKRNMSMSALSATSEADNPFKERVPYQHFSDASSYALVSYTWGTRSVDLFVQGTGHIVLRVDGKSFSSPEPVVENTGSWHTITATHNGFRACLYADGELLDCGALELHEPLRRDGWLVLGRGSDGSIGRMQGRMDEVRLWSHALLEAEVRLFDGPEASRGLPDSEIEVTAAYFPVSECLEDPYLTGREAVSLWDVRNGADMLVRGSMTWAQDSPLCRESGQTLINDFARNLDQPPSHARTAAYVIAGFAGTVVFVLFAHYSIGRVRAYMSKGVRYQGERLVSGDDEDNRAFRLGESSEDEFGTAKERESRAPSIELDSCDDAEDIEAALERANREMGSFSDSDKE